MGLVYLAEQVSLGRTVAVKVLREDLSLQPGMAERFRREALLLSSVEHPAVVRVIDFGQSHGAACLVMDLVQGQTLELAVQHGPFPLERALRVLLQLSQGLAAIHSRGIVHRDLKPDNVVLTQTPEGEQARLLDFGIARLAGADAPGSSVTQVGFVLGTPEYLSPEQGLGQPLDPRSDLYSFGVLAYRLLSGTHPFPGPTPRDYVVQHVQSSPRPLHEAAPLLHEQVELVDLVMRCLAKAREARPESALVIAAALGRLGARGGSGTGAVPILLTEQSAVREPPLATAALPGAVSVVKPPPPASTATTSPSTTGERRALGRQRNLTLMLTDLKGFTQRTSQQTLEENAQMLKQHDALLVPLLGRYDGRLVQKRGDALLAVFSSPTQSLLCGMAMQDALWRFNEGKAAADQLHVRVCVHGGEVLEDADGLRGEPVTVITAVEGVAEAGDVVFTDAVYLSMSRAEVSSERWTTLRVPGREEELVLHRCSASTQGAPFGERDLQRRSRVADTLQSALARLEPFLSAARSVPQRFRNLPLRQRLLAGAGASLLAIAAVVLLGLWRTPERRARRQIEARHAAEALQVLDDAPQTVQILMLRAAALHQVSRHDEELDLVRRLKSGELPIEPLLLEGLSEDFGAKEASALRDALSGLPRERTLPVLQALAQDGPPRVQWGALRFVDLEYAGQGLPLVSLYSAALEPPDCRVRNLAVKRLRELKDPAALPALRRLKGTPRRKASFFSDDDCGQEQAGSAIRVIEREAKLPDPG